MGALSPQQIHRVGRRPDDFWRSGLLGAAAGKLLRQADRRISSLPLWGIA